MVIYERKETPLSVNIQGAGIEQVESHGFNWTDVEKSNGFDKGPRKMEIIHSYPSPPNGWRP